MAEGGKQAVTNPSVLMSSSSLSRAELRSMPAGKMVERAHHLGFDGVALLAMRPLFQHAIRDVISGPVPDVAVLQEPWQLIPKWTNPKSVITNALFRVAMPPTHLGPWQPGAGLVAQARRANPVHTMVYLDPSGRAERDRSKVERLGGEGSVAVRVTADFMRITGADSPDGIVNALAERNLLGVFETFESGSRSPKTGEPPNVNPLDWLMPVAREGRLGGIGFSGYRVDQMRVDPERVRTGQTEMDSLFRGGQSTGELRDQIVALREVCAPYVVVNMPFDGARGALQRGLEQDSLASSPLDVLALAASAVRAFRIGAGEVGQPA